MFIQVRASNPGFEGRSRAGRRFTNGQLFRMEVVPDPEGAPPLDARAPLDADGASDMTRISRAGYAQIKADPAFSWMEGDSVDASMSGAVVDEARAQLARINAELADARLEIASLKQQLADAQSTATDSAAKIDKASKK